MQLTSWITRAKVPVFAPPSPVERRAALAGIKWWLFEKIGYEPHVPQMDFHLSTCRFRFACAGTRGGKSLAAAMEIVAYMFTGAVRIWIVGQTYKLTEKEFRYVYQIMHRPEIMDLIGCYPFEPSLGGKCVYNPDQGNMVMRTIWGAEVECISLERSGGAFGEEVDLIVMSEGAQIRNPRQLWEQVLFGRLGSRQGDLIIPTTPAGRTNEWDKDGWLYEMYLKGYNDAYPEYYTREWPSWANPHWPEDPYWIRSWMNPLLFSEQYEGKFMVISGAVFDRFSEKVHVIQPFVPPPHWRRYEAIDPGYAGKFVWISSVMSEANILYINDEYSDSETDFETRAELIKERIASQYGIHKSLWNRYAKKHNIVTRRYIDPGGGGKQAIAELRKYGLPGTEANKKDILVTVDRVQRRLRWSNIYPPTLYVTANCIDTIEALKMHSYGSKPAGGARKPADDAYKHWGDCVRYLCGGYLIPSEPVEVEEEYDGNSYWAVLMEMTSLNDEGVHPLEMTPYMRRRAIGW